MPKGPKQKLKLYYLAHVMLEKTDDKHMITMPEIQESLEAYGVTADRRSLYDDLESLRVLGIDVIGEKIGHNYYYHVGMKQFQLAELKLLVDAIQSSKFITEKKSNDLIKKLTNMASRYEATQLKRQVVVRGRVKTMNESIYYFVDDVHRAIAENKKLQFDYMEWNEKKQMVPHRKDSYVISPWALTWDDENYYLIAFDEDEDCIKHFRVDKMKNIAVLEEKRTGKEAFKAFDLAKYARMSFGMFSGKATMVKISFVNNMTGVFIDRFGKNITVVPSKKKGWSETTVEVALSDHFFAWIFALGSQVKIIGPTAVVERYKDELNERIACYE